MPRLTKEQLKRKLDYHYKAFDKSKLSPDPLEFPHKFSYPLDIEVSAFLSSVFAFGNIKQIITTLDKLHSLISSNPFDYITNFNRKEEKKFSGFIHRFFTENDIIKLFYGLKRVYETYGSLKYLFFLYDFPKEINYKNTISFFSNNLLDICRDHSQPSDGLKFMFPDPFKGSACKRMNLFLRWMIRKDELDFGLWGEFTTSKLVIPVDTHIARICTELKLTKRKNVSWLMAEEITENLKKFNPADPVKYDFAICHIGMRKLEF